MRDAQDDTCRLAQRAQPTIGWWLVSVLGLMELLMAVTAPTSAKAMGRLLPYPSDPGLEIVCSNPVMKSAPTFLSYPKGSAKYPFTSYCTSPSIPGAMTLRWEGSWNPSETRQDRPNAVESITITAYEGFLPSREPGAKIFMYWTGRCDKDPWLQPSTCDRLGTYVPDDVREALSQIDHNRFPLTWQSISPTLKQQLVRQYQQVNQPVSTQSRLQNMTTQQKMAIQPQQSRVITQSQHTQAMTVQPQAALPKPNAAVSDLARSGIFARGVEDKEGQSTGQQEKDGQPADVETSAMAVLEEGTPEIVEPTAVTLDRPLYIISAKPNAVVLKPGVYEIGTIMGLQLALAKEGQETVLLHAQQGRHDASITQPLALVVPGQKDDVHLVYLTPDGRRFDAVATSSGVMSRGIDREVALPDTSLQAAITAASKAGSSESRPCQPNTADTGPRWIPVPCTMPASPNQVSTP